MTNRFRLGYTGNKIRMITTQKKIIIYFLIAVVLVFFVFNSIFYKLYSANVEQIIIKEGKSGVTKSAEFTDSIIQYLQSTADIVQGNLLLQQRMTQQDNNHLNYLIELEMVNTLQSISNNSVGKIASIDLYLNDSKRLLTTDYGVYSVDAADLTEYFLQMQLENDRFMLTTEYRKKLTFMEDRNYEQITLIRPYYNLNTGSRVGLLAINMDKYVIKNIIKRDADSTSIIMDGNHNIVISEFSRAHSNLPQLRDIIIGKLTEEEADPFFYFDDEKQIFVSDKSEYVDWTYITVFPASASMKQMDQLRDFILFLFLVMNVITAMVLILLMSGKIFRKVNKLIASMKEVEKGNFDIVIRHDDQDEFGFMYSSFNNMTGKIKSLFNELYQQKLLQKDAELKLLQSKINPHFLYNIFDSMNWLIQLERYEELEPLVDAVSNYYRKSLNVGRDFISIADTIDQLKSYVEIQKIRFKDRFTCTYEFEKELMDMQILNFMLQPLVENAICHGIEPKAEKCHIHVKGYRTGDGICLSVEDDGMGINAEKLEEINTCFENLQAQSDDNFAITNINKRIKLFYGEKYGLRIASEPGEGTLVTMTLPVTVPAEVEEST